MSHDLTFVRRYNYHSNQDGIFLDVAIRHGDAVSTFEAKVDTGASFCIFDRTHGEAVGLEIESGLRQEVGTVQGTFPVYGHQVAIQTLEFEFEAFVYVAGYAGFAKNVLGRRGWLDMLKVGIVDYDRELFLNWY